MNKVVLITGAAKRIGAVITRLLHESGMNVVLHYHHSEAEAFELCKHLNDSRPNSAKVFQADIKEIDACQHLIDQAQKVWGRLDVLVNNASSFYPTPLEQVSENDWEDLVGSNLKGPFFLCQAAATHLVSSKGNIVNIVDIHADKPLKNYPVYCIAKAGLVMLTKSLARELGPSIRVNGVAPGAILWPNEQSSVSAETQQYIINQTLLKRQGNPQDIAETVLFLIKQSYITGQIIAVDGGRSIR